MTSDGTNCYTYNDANQLSKVTNCNSGQTIAQYIYDYQGNRIEKKVYNNNSLQQTVYTPYKDYQTVKLASNGATLNTSYYYINDELAAQKNPDGSKYYFLSDNLGSTSVLTDQNANVVENTTYLPFGQIQSGGTDSKYLYTGQQNDQETNLDYYNARYYDPSIQHFTQPDSELPNVYDPQQLNRYAYVRNNPMTVTDPTGHNPAFLAFLAQPEVALSALAGTAVAYLADSQFRAATNTFITDAYDSSLFQKSHIKDYTNNSSDVLESRNSSGEGSSYQNDSSGEGSGQNGSSIDSSDNGNGPKSNNIDQIKKWVNDNFWNPENSPDEYEQHTFDRFNKDGSLRNDGFNNYNPNTEEELSPDLQHPEGILPHWDYTDSTGQEFRIFEDGSVEQKLK